MPRTRSWLVALLALAAGCAHAEGGLAARPTSLPPMAVTVPGRAPQRTAARAACSGGTGCG